MSAMCEKNLRNLDFFAIFQGFEENGVICGHMGLIFYSWSEMGPDAAIFCSYFGVISLSGFGQFYVFFPPRKFRYRQLQRSRFLRWAGVLVLSQVRTRRGLESFIHLANLILVRYFSL